MSHDKPNDYGAMYRDNMGRPLAVGDYPCGCCGALVQTNVWAFHGTGVRCWRCREVRCQVHKGVRRCEQDVPENADRGAYTGKPVTIKALFMPDCYDDRQVVFVSEARVQYDSATVRNGRKYPTIDRAKFEAWAGSDVTAGYPDGDWAAWDK